MILLDTHIWIWWVQGDPRLTHGQLRHLQTQAPNGLGVSVMSVWETAMLVQYGKLVLPHSVDVWISTALAHPDVRLIDLSVEIVIEATRLPDPFHRDPADRALVATARKLGVPILTADGKILAYPYVQCLT